MTNKNVPRINKGGIIAMAKGGRAAEKKTKTEDRVAFILDHNFKTDKRLIISAMKTTKPGINDLFCTK